jgi:hypothetical protein
MKLTLTFAVLVAAIGLASALPTYVPYALVYSELQPESYGLVLLPLQEGTSREEQGGEVLVPEVPEVPDGHPAGQEVFTVRKLST